MRDKATFFSSYYEGLKDLDNETFARLCKALLSYMFEDEEPELAGLERTVFLAWKPNVDASKAKADNGKIGGASESKSEANPKQTESKPEANPKQTASKPEAKAKQTGSKTEANGKQNGSKTEANPKQNGSKPEANRKQEEIEEEIEEEVEVEEEIDKDKEIEKNKNARARARTRKRFEDDALQEAWEDFREMRKRIRKPMTDHAEDLIEKKLREMAVDIFGDFSTEKAIELLEQSTVKGWSDIYPLKEPMPSAAGAIDWDNI